MKIFFISPVREWDELPGWERKAIRAYVEKLEGQGHEVHWPLRDTDQIDSVGVRICRDNRLGLLSADEVHIWWCSTSGGSKFDLGIWFRASPAASRSCWPTPTRSPGRITRASRTASCTGADGWRGRER